MRVWPVPASPLLPGVENLRGTEQLYENRRERIVGYGVRFIHVVQECYSHQPLTCFAGNIKHESCQKFPGCLSHLRRSGCCKRVTSAVPILKCSVLVKFWCSRLHKLKLKRLISNSMLTHLTFLDCSSPLYLPP